MILTDRNFNIFFFESTKLRYFNAYVLSDFYVTKVVQTFSSFFFSLTFATRYL